MTAGCAHCEPYTAGWRHGYNASWRHDADYPDPDDLARYRQGYTDGAADRLLKIERSGW